MTQEDKELLERDLCSRFGAGADTIVRWKDKDYGITGIIHGRVVLTEPFMSYDAGTPLIEEVKPYLRPIKDITVKEMDRLNEIDKKRMIFSARHLTYHIDGEIIDLFNERNIDWRGLIGKGLAIEAPEGMYTVYLDE